MATNNIDKMSYAELLKFHARIKGAITAKRASEASAAKEQLRAAAAKAGFSVEELFGKRGYRKGTVKYRNPKDASQTWSGRGRKPNWLVDAVKKGAKLDTFAV